MKDEKFHFMDSSDVYKKYLDTALRFLSFRPRSEKEVRDNLEKKKASPEIIEKIIARLKAHRFVDDEEFTRWWIEQRSKFRPKSMRIIKLELKQKGVNKDIIEKVITGDTLDVQSELNLAKKIMEKKISKFRGLEKREIYQKLGAYLARKGFDWETIKQVIDSGLTAEP